MWVGPPSATRGVLTLASIHGSSSVPGKLMSRSRPGSDHAGTPGAASAAVLRVSPGGTVAPSHRRRLGYSPEPGTVPISARQARASSASSRLAPAAGATGPGPGS
eukprot:751727-Hanusia_phi.AAC.1